MNDGKVLSLLSRLSEVEDELGSPDVMKNRKRYLLLTQEHKHLTQLDEAWTEFSSVKKTLSENRNLLKTEKDLEFLALLEEEISVLDKRMSVLEQKIASLIVPPNPDDHRNTIVELRAGTGGDEAALFVGNCARMYMNYAQKKGWMIEVLSSTPSEIGGYKEFQFVLSGENVHRFMQYEGGIHRVQRVPITETQGRVHTSAITIAIIMEPDDEEQIALDEKDLRIDTYRSSGAGGQHVNTTDSAVRITHIPTGIVAHCQDERSQIKNRAKCLRLLSAKVSEKMRVEKEEEVSLLRAQQVGTGDRSGRIRTYNFAQNRVTDHRIHLTLYKLESIMEGDLDELLSALVSFFYKQRFEGA